VVVVDAAAAFVVVGVAAVLGYMAAAAECVRGKCRF